MRLSRGKSKYFNIFLLWGCHNVTMSQCHRGVTDVTDVTSVTGVTGVNE